MPSSAVRDRKPQSSRFYSHTQHALSQGEQVSRGWRVEYRGISRLKSENSSGISRLLRRVRRWWKMPTEEFDLNFGFRKD